MTKERVIWTIVAVILLLTGWYLLHRADQKLDWERREKERVLKLVDGYSKTSAMLAKQIALVARSRDSVLRLYRNRPFRYLPGDTVSWIDTLPGRIDTVKAPLPPPVVAKLLRCDFLVNSCGMQVTLLELQRDTEKMRGDSARTALAEIGRTPKLLGLLPMPKCIAGGGVGVQPFEGWRGSASLGVYCGVPLKF